MLEGVGNAADEIILTNGGHKCFLVARTQVRSLSLRRYPGLARAGVNQQLTQIPRLNYRDEPAGKAAGLGKFLPRRTGGGSLREKVQSGAHCRAAE